MNWVVIAIIVLAVGGIYALAKQRGRREKAKELDQREVETDKKEVQDELDEKRNSNAWDNLNDTIDG